MRFQKDDNDDDDDDDYFATTNVASFEEFQYTKKVFLLQYGILNSTIGSRQARQYIGSNRRHPNSI